MKHNITKRLSAVALLLLSSLGVAIADNKLSIDNLFIACGETKTVAINLENTDEISIIHCKVNLPKGLNMVAKGEPNAKGVTYMNTAKGERTQDYSDVQITQNATQAANERHNEYTLLMFDMAGSKIEAGNGTVVTFDVKANCNFSESDVTEITLTDMDIVGGDIAESASKVVNSESDRMVVMTAEELTLQKDVETTFSLNLDNEAPFWSYVVYVNLPAGLQLLNAETTERLDGSIACKERGEQRYSLFYVPATSSTLVEAGSGAIANITVMATEDLDEGAVITFDTFSCMDTNYDYSYAPDIAVGVKTEVPTGIDEIGNADDANDGQTFDLSGRRVLKSTKGVVIKRVNGKMTKVLVK